MKSLLKLNQNHPARPSAIVLYLLANVLEYVYNLCLAIKSSQVPYCILIRYTLIKLFVRYFNKKNIRYNYYKTLQKISILKTLL